MEKWSKNTIRDIIIMTIVCMIAVWGASFLTRKTVENKMNESEVIEVEKSDESLKKVFLEKAKQVISLSKTKHLNSKMSGSSKTNYYQSGNNDLSISGIYYYVKINKEGNIVHFIANDDNYKLFAGSSNSSTNIKEEEIDTKYPVKKINTSFNSLIGDLNQNGMIDLEDASLINESFNLNIDLADINNDGFVNSDDSYEIITILSRGYASGDVNKDGKINSKDSDLIKGYVNGSKSLDETQKALADLNKDGKVNENDLNLTKSATNKVKYIVKHWKQKIPAFLKQEGESEYELADTQSLKAKPSTTISPNTKSYTGFKSPSKKKVTIAKDGSTVVNYYYTRKKYKIIINTECSRKLSVKSTSFMFMGGLCASAYDGGRPNYNRSEELFTYVDNEFYYGEEIEVDASNSSDNVALYDGTKKIKDGKIFTIKVGSENKTYTIMNSTIKVKYTVKHWYQDIPSVNQDNNIPYSLHLTEEVKAIPLSKVTPKVISYASPSRTPFKAPETQTVTVAKDGSTVVNYYYTRNKFKFEFLSDQGLIVNGKIKFSDRYSSFYVPKVSGAINPSPAVRYTTDLYCDQEVEINLENAKDSISWYAGSDYKLGTGKTYKFKMPNYDYKITAK